MQYEQAPFRDRYPLVNISAKPTVRPASLTSQARPDAGERLGSLLFVLGGVAITLSLAGAIWMTDQPRPESRTVPLASSPDARLAAPMVVNAPAVPVRRRDVPQNGVAGGGLHTPMWRPTTAPLAWNDLTLMLRTGLTDDEVIAACAGKQLTTAIGSEEAGQLRELGAGSRLINYLLGRPVYNAPTSASIAVASTSARQVYVPAASYAPAATPYPVVDYAARDRKVASLKKQIDDLDEQIRVARSRPNDYLWPGVYYRHSGDGTNRQQSSDGYLKSLEEQRDNLRREKWQLEGR